MKIRRSLQLFFSCFKLYIQAFPLLYNSFYKHPGVYIFQHILNWSQTEFFALKEPQKKNNFAVLLLPLPSSEVSNSPHPQPNFYNRKKLLSFKIKLWSNIVNNKGINENIHLCTHPSTLWAMLQLSH